MPRFVPGELGRCFHSEAGPEVAGGNTPRPARTGQDSSTGAGDPARARVAHRTITGVVNGFDLCAVLRRIRRTADLSQRELASAAGLSVSAVAHAEAGTRDLPSRALARAAGLAGLRLTLLDADGREITGMDPDGARDATRRRLPAHLDTQHTDEIADRWAHRPDRQQPWFTFGLDRAARDRERARVGTPDDHDVEVPGDSPADRARARQRAAWRAWDEERRRRIASGELRPVDAGFVCTCPPACDEVDDGSGPPRHAADCTCGCDLV